MNDISYDDQSEKSACRERYFKVEQDWTETLAQLAYHQQEAEILRLKKAALQPELIERREEFLVQGPKVRIGGDRLQQVFATSRA